MRDSRCPAASILNDPPESDRSHPGPPSRFDESGNVDVSHLEHAADFARALRGVVVEFNRKDGADGRWFPNTYQRRATRSASAVSFLRACWFGAS